MSDAIPVDAVVVEKTFVGKVSFPASVPERFFDLLRFPEDLYEHVEKMGLTQRTVKFLLAALNGKWSLSANIDLQDIAIKTGMQYSEMDSIVRDLVEKNYATLGKRLDLYRFWVVLLHVKGVRFDVAKDS
ncbi:MAG TPA: hypothetical protein VL171_03970 [Verrucomicrobiae bacterium]|nr:hypothetical protein [Verrucomicrobiae bacterium]